MGDENKQDQDRDRINLMVLKINERAAALMVSRFGGVRTLPNGGITCGIEHAVKVVKTPPPDPDRGVIRPLR